MKTKEQRLNNIIGQIEGIKRLMKNEADCISVLTQLKSVRSAVGSVIDSVVEDQMENCMQSLSKKDKELFSKIKSYVRTN